MARSVHTDPVHIRAARRLRAPGAPRGQHDLTTQRALARSLKRWGVIVTGSTTSDTGRHGGDASGTDGHLLLPRIRTSRPRRGFYHALTRRDIVAKLELFGKVCFYGLKSIELCSGPAPDGDPLHLGRLIVPGRILLFAQPIGVWTLPGTLARRERRRLETAGAVVETVADGLQTTVRWPGTSLREFMLLDVLMHEIGHHILQHHKGKRLERIVRTKHHEAFAERFARRCRHLYEATQRRDSPLIGQDTISPTPP